MSDNEDYYDNYDNYDSQNDEDYYKQLEQLESNQDQQIINEEFENQAIQEEQKEDLDDCMENEIPVQDPNEQGDVIDVILEDNIHNSADNLENCIFDLEEFDYIYLRLAKLFNHISEKLNILEKINEQVQQDCIKFENISLIIQCFFRCMYAVDNSQLAKSTFKVVYRLKIDSRQVNNLYRVLIDIEKYTFLISPLVVDEFRRLFCFLLSPPNFFVAETDNLFKKYLEQILDELSLEPKYTHFDLLSLTYFSNPDLITIWMLHNHEMLSAQLESKLESMSKSINSLEQILQLKNLHFFIVVSRNQKIAKILMEESFLHINLYKAVKYSDPIFNIQTEEQKLWSTDPTLIQTIVILLKSLISQQQADKKFADMLLEDFLQLIERRKFNFIYSIIVPLLTYSCSEFVPICFHQMFQANEVKEKLLPILKSIQNSGLKEVSNVQDGRIGSKIFDESDRDAFQSQLETYYLQYIRNTEPNYKKESIQAQRGSWRSILNIEQQNNSMNFDKAFPKLLNKNNLVFIFSCYNSNGYTSKYGAFLSDTFQQGQQKDQNIFDQTQGKYLKASSNAQSFYFYYRQDKKMHFISNKKKQVQEQMYLCNTKDMVKMVFSGLEFFFDNQLMIYINFGNLDLSRFNVPLGDILNKDEINQDDKDYIAKPEEIYLQKCEIWQYDNSQMGGTDLDAVLNMFSIKEDLQSIYLNYLKYQRLEKIIFVPYKFSLNELIEKIFQKQRLDKDLNVDNLLMELETLKGKIYIDCNVQDMLPKSKKQKSNIVIDLFYTENLQEENLNYEVDFMDHKKVRTGNKQMINYFEQKLNGLKHIINKMGKIAYLNQIDNLIIFFYDVDLLLSLKGYSQYLLYNEDFLKITLSLVFSIEYKKDKASVASFHKIILILYQSLKRLLKYDQSADLRYYILQNQILQQILNRAEIYMGGMPYYQKKTKKQKMKELLQNQTEVQQIPQKANLSLTKPKGPPKGVGYTGGSSQTNVQIHKKLIKKKKLEKEQIDYSSVSLISEVLGQDYMDFMIEILLKNVFYLLKCDGMLISIQLHDILQKSKLIRIIIHIFKKFSFIDMLKKQKFFKNLLKLIQQICLRDELLDLLVHEYDDTTIFNQLMSLDEAISFYSLNYQIIPENQKNLQDKLVSEKQEQEIQNVQDMIKFFKDKYQDIKERLLQYNFIEIEKENQKSNESDKMLEEIEAQNSTMNFEQFYPQLLKPFCVDSYDMKEGSSSYQGKHHYSGNVTSQNPSQTKISRIIKEISDLQNNLPIYATNAIFVRYDKNRMDLMKAMIFGVAETPYAHGAFIYDLYFDDNYPNGPPKCNLSTTGHGKVRFNPNLYHCGKVCLSLLGTWRGQNSEENWNANQSTILQILLSIQSIVMSQYVYYNEPGYEGSMGTDEGESYNNAYSNIVKLNNIKYAMIEQIQNPPKGFEDVVLKSFYLKKDMIIKEVRSWLEQKNQPANYAGLVQSHNSALCQQYKTNFPAQLEVEVKNLEQALEKLKLNMDKNLSLPLQKENQIKVNVDQKSIIACKNDTDDEDGGQIANIDEVDVSYDPKMDIDDQELLNRQSRTIGAIGLDAYKKQASSKVFLVGANSLGIEIAKNIVLTGVNLLTLYDDQLVTPQDLCGQFFLDQNSIGIQRAQASIDKLSHLNLYTKVNTPPLGLKILDFLSLSEFSFDKYTSVILINQNEKEANIINQFCREHNIYFISVDIYGLYSRTFVDFGDTFIVQDQDGKDVQEFMIKNIDENGKVQLIDGFKHGYQDGDVIIFKGIVEDEEEIEQKTLNSSEEFKIKIISATEFTVGSLQKYKKYVRNGIVRQVKKPLQIKFESLRNSQEEPKFDDQMGNIFEEKQLQERTVINHCINLLNLFIRTEKRTPQPWNINDAENYIQNYFFKSMDYILKISNTKSEDLIVAKLIITSIALKFILTANSIFPTMSAILGGIISQEVFKSITKKWVPINQCLYYQISEILPEIDFSQFIIFENDCLTFNKDKLQYIINQFGFSQKYDRYDYIRTCIGENCLQKIQNSKLFMVGVGAIGCELLKNFSMLGIGSRKQGKIFITDPDIIENSNLSRQFLFREKHIRMPKSSTAAASVIQMNPDMKNQIVSRLDKVHDQTENIFNEDFFLQLNIVSNALDNVQARKYMDLRCLKSKIPLIDSGTLGPNGHVQVIVPDITETYGSQEDPQEEHEIPVCTLKMFPEESIHCIEWARDKFGRIFNQKPSSFQRVLEVLTKREDTFPEEKQVREAHRLFQKRPKNLEECVYYARNKFEKYYNNDIQALLHVYPLEKKNHEGQLFWTFPKRPPNTVKFDPDNQLHQDFIHSLACLRALTYNVSLPQDIRTPQQKQMLAKIAYKFEPKKFQLDQQKLDQIKQEVEKTKQNQSQEPESIIPMQQQQTYEELINEIKNLYSNESVNVPNPQIFEKDEDSNFHIDLIYALSNLRCICYNLPTLSWLQTKLKAGRIIPALATTTSCVAGLQTIEVVKLLMYGQQVKIEKVKNSFVNLQVPFLSQCEPGNKKIYKIGPNKLEVSIWDKWEVNINRNTKVKEFFELLHNQYGVYPNDISQGLQQLYIFDLMNVEFKLKENQEFLENKLSQIVTQQGQNKYSDLNITFTDYNPKQQQQSERQMEIENIDKNSKQYIIGTPIIRVIFE